MFEDDCVKKIERLLSLFNKNQLKYTTMRANGGWDAFRMVVVKLHPCNSKRELDIEEERYRVELQASLNSIRCYITDESFFQTAILYHIFNYNLDKQSYLKNFNLEHCILKKQLYLFNFYNTQYNIFNFLLF